MNNDNQSLINFVIAEFDEDTAANLTNIHQGGLNNSKGCDYENFFQLYKVFEIASKDNCDFSKHLVATQVMGFVDDICYCDKEQSIKYNYQAKNSDGATSDWNDETTDRFNKQRVIDQSFFNFDKTQNCLLTSSKTKAESNQNKIPDELKLLDRSEYFPYKKNLIELINNSENKLKEYIETLICDDDLSNIEYSARLILGNLQSNNYISIEDIFSNAQSEAYPNPFYKFRTVDVTLPHWLLQELNVGKLSNIDYEVKNSKLCIQYKGFEIAILIHSLTKVDISNISDEVEFLTLCLKLQANELCALSQHKGK